VNGRKIILRFGGPRGGSRPKKDRAEGSPTSSSDSRSTSSTRRFPIDERAIDVDFFDRPPRDESSSTPTTRAFDSTTLARSRRVRRRKANTSDRRPRLIDHRIRDRSRAASAGSSRRIDSPVAAAPPRAQSSGRGGAGEIAFANEKGAP